MTRRKVFSTYRSVEEQEPIEIVLNDEVFLFRPSISGMELLEFLDGFEADDAMKSISTITNILFQTVMDTDEDRFSEYVKNPDNNVDVETLSNIAAWLLESYSNHPTESSQESSDGSATSGPGLMVVPSSDTDSTSVPQPPSNSLL